jgi:hypothetical protein
MVAGGIIENSERSYKRLGDLISNGRMAGLIDWDAIEDRGRNLRKNSHWEDPAGVIASARSAYGIDMWRGQKYRPEVWVEKEALEGVVRAACADLDVPYFACKGYNSQSAQQEAGQRMLRYVHSGYTPVIFHLGDHDPSGIDMTRDNHDRLEVFMNGKIHVERLALNMDQIEQYNPPPNPAKATDSRFVGYAEIYGDESWELDAMPPQVLVDTIRSAILDIRDDFAWDMRAEMLEEGQRLLEQTERRWKDIVRFLEGQ